MTIQMTSLAEEFSANEVEVRRQTIPNLPPGIEMALLTGCQDRHYAFGLAMALASKGVFLDIIGSDEIDSPELHSAPNLHFLNFREGQSDNANFVQKVWKLLVYYAKLIRYAARSRPKMVHILWNYKLELFDRTRSHAVLQGLGKKRLYFTAHNVNQARRDSKIRGSIAPRSRFSTACVITSLSILRR